MSSDPLRDHSVHFVNKKSRYNRKRTRANTLVVVGPMRYVGDSPGICVRPWNIYKNFWCNKKAAYVALEALIEELNFFGIVFCIINFIQQFGLDPVKHSLTISLTIVSIVIFFIHFEMHLRDIFFPHIDIKLWYIIKED